MNKMDQTQSTIVALATAPLTSAIHLLRVSGPDTYEIVGKLVKKPIKKQNYQMEFVHLYDENKFLDEAILLKYVAPNSYTGEDMVEISCHGSPYIATLIIEALIKYGAKIAQPGEFTQRAYLNKKMDLLQAAAVNNIINSQSYSSLKIAQNGLNKSLTKTIKDLSFQLFKLLGQIEVNIDYPEYDDVPQISNEQIVTILKSLINQIKKIIDSTVNAQPIINGINVVIVGKPNVGKSSLLNALLNQNKAIVSSVPGTTRDVLQYSARIGDLSFNFIDTAGIHQPKSKIEKLGINQAKKSINEANLVLFVTTAGHKLDCEEKKILSLIKNKQYLIIKNKTDLLKTKPQDKCVYISAKKRDIGNLVKTLANLKLQSSFDQNLVLPSMNNVQQLKSVVRLLNDSLKALKNKQTVDLVAESIHQAYDTLLEIIGEEQNLNFIDELFKHFCVGK